MNRKQRRAMAKATNTEKALATEVALFGFLPDKCDVLVGGCSSGGRKGSSILSSVY